MNNTKFARELKSLICYVRQYGIEHISFKINSIEAFPKEQEQLEEFLIQVHKGFFMAQDRVIYLLKKVLLEQKELKKTMSQVRCRHEKDKEQEVKQSLNNVRYQERVLRKIIDSLAWQIFNYDLTTLRRLYYGQELIDITDSNLESEISFTKNYVRDNPEAFVLISDLTSFIQIGDIVTFSKDKGAEIYELKEGPVNCKIFEVLGEFAENQCPKYLQLRLEDENESFRKHFERNIKQLSRINQVSETISKGYGTDLLMGQKVRIHQDEIVLDTYTDIVNKLLNDCNKKGYSISVIEGCLLIGVYDVRKCPSCVFDAWAKEEQIEAPIYDIRESFYDPLSFPIFLHSFSDTSIVDIILGKKVIKMTIDLKKWLNTFENDGCKVRWMSRKETARINANMKGSNKIFDINGQGIELEKNEMSMQIGTGIFSRMFTSFNTPLSIKKLLMTTYSAAEEFEGFED